MISQIGFDLMDRKQMGMGIGMERRDAWMWKEVRCSCLCLLIAGEIYFILP